MSVPLKPELHAATIQACSAQLRPWCEPGALSELPARAAAGGGAQRGKGGKTKKRAVRKLPVALVRALAAAHAHVEGLAGEAAGRQVPQEAVEELTARAAKVRWLHALASSRTHTTQWSARAQGWRERGGCWSLFALCAVDVG